jgi:uncharacterized protein YjbI with pentapeptide repeats
MTDKISHEELVQNFPALLQIEESIREHVLDVFSETKNGTPDGITQAGCLELALKSNEVGEDNKGDVVWNAWRKLFPATINRNQSDFSGYKFSGANEPNFSFFHFGDYANFSKVKIINARFAGAVWGCYSTFDDATFGPAAKFQLAQWGNGASFANTQWDGLAAFEGAKWEADSKFIRAQWGDNAKFCGAEWLGDVFFRGARWGGGADFSDAQWHAKANFEGSQWAGSATFKATRWGGHTNFQGTSWEQLEQRLTGYKTFEQAKEWAAQNGAGPDLFHDIDFSGAIFLKRVNFSNRRFKAKTNFGPLAENIKRLQAVRDALGNLKFKANGQVFFEESKDQSRPAYFAAAPIFHGCELHQDTSFDGAQFPPDIGETEGNEEAARAYRTLKLAFSKQQAVREEQRFFRHEMAEERLQHWNKAVEFFRDRKNNEALIELSRWLLHLIYKTASGYGFSSRKPFFMWILLTVLCAGLYAGKGESVCVLVIDVVCELDTKTLNTSLLNTVPISGLGDLKNIEYGLWRNAGIVLHKLASLLCFFLIGLALRNLFKLK